jgi:hypothetical protein
VTKAHEWIELYEEFNSKDSQDEKAELVSTLHRYKYDALHLLNRIKLRFKPGDVDGDRLLAKLGDLLDPGKLTPPDRYTSWRAQSDKAVFDTRVLLKEEWEATKNPVRKMRGWQRWMVIGLTFSLALAAVTDTVVASWPAVKSIAAALEVHVRGAGAVSESAAVHMGTDENGHAAVCVNGSAYDIPGSGYKMLKARARPTRADGALMPDLCCQN